MQRGGRLYRRISLVGRPLKVFVVFLFWLFFHVYIFSPPSSEYVFCHWSWASQPVHASGISSLHETILRIFFSRAQSLHKSGLISEQIGGARASSLPNTATSLITASVYSFYAPQDTRIRSRNPKLWTSDSMPIDSRLIRFESSRLLKHNILMIGESCPITREQRQRQTRKVWLLTHTRRPSVENTGNHHRNCYLNFLSPRRHLILIWSEWK